MKIQIKKLDPEAIIPTYAKNGDAGADLYSNEAKIIYPGDWQLVRTGIAISMPNNFVGLIHPRSGMAAKFAVTVCNAPGTVDSGYRGEVMVNLINHGTEPFYIGIGDRIAQIVFQEYVEANFVEVDTLDESERGLGGHGSTGAN